MKADLHPKYFDCKVHCGCGNEFTTRATVKELRIEICSVCHPFYSGKQKFVDSAGRIDSFLRRYGEKKGAAKAGESPAAAPAGKSPAKSPAKPAAKAAAAKPAAKAPAAKADKSPAEKSPAEKSSDQAK